VGVPDSVVGAAGATTAGDFSIELASTKNEEKDTVILHTNDVHGRIVEEVGNR